MQAEVEYQKRLNFELQQTGVANPHPIRQWYSAKTYVLLYQWFSFSSLINCIFIFNRGTLYRPEKPVLFDDDANLLPPRRHTAQSQQSRPTLPVPIVYH